MTVSEAIIKWLKQFNSEEHGNLDKINTELQGPKVDSYSLVRAPVQNVKPYVSGKKVYTDHYTFQARLASQSDEDRVDNNGFGEALENWVRERDANSEFPELTDAKVQSVSITTPFYVGRTETNNYVYQMTMAIKYEKEN